MLNSSQGRAEKNEVDIQEIITPADEVLSEKNVSTPTKKLLFR